MQEHSCLPSSWSHATVTVIPKPGTDHLLPKSYRPISLLNVDLKILTMSLATRFNSFISQYISSDQGGFIPGRDISDNTIRLLHLIQYCKCTNSSAVALALDLEKCSIPLRFPI